jgi:TrmH family RNA methyltransferase
MLHPRQPVNVGQVARVMKNFGYGELLLVRPAVDLHAARPFAAHAGDVLEGARTSTFGQLRDRFDLVVGTTAIRAWRPANLARLTVGPAELAAHLRKMKAEACLVLGREATGMTNRELARCDVVARIPTGTAYPTLNIAHALAIFLYELQRVPTREAQPVASRGQRVVALSYAARLSALSGYPPHKRPLLQRGLQQLLGGAVPRGREVSLLTGLLRRAIGALEKRVRYA